MPRGGKSRGKRSAGIPLTRHDADHGQIVNVEPRKEYVGPSAEVEVIEGIGARGLVPDESYTKVALTRGKMDRPQTRTEWLMKERTNLPRRETNRLLGPVETRDVKKTAAACHGVAGPVKPFSRKMKLPRGCTVLPLGWKIFVFTDTHSPNMIIFDLKTMTATATSLKEMEGGNQVFQMSVPIRF